MADADCATCPKCGAPRTADETPGLCPRCLATEHSPERIENPTVIPSLRGHSRRKPTLVLAAAASAAFLVCGVWFVNRPGQHSAERSPHFRRGDVLVDQGKMDEAAAEFREALQVDPELAEAHVYLGTILGHQGKLEEAVGEFREAIRIDPALSEAHAYLGKVLGHQGKLREAATSLRKAVRLNPDSALAHYNLGITEGTQGDLEKATSEFRAVVRLKPNDVEARYNLGNTLQARGKLKDAVAEYREVIRLEPGHAKAHHNLGVALHRQGMLEEAIVEYREAVRTKPDDVAFLYTLAAALSEQGELELAIIAYRDALRLKPDLIPAHSHLARALVMRPGGLRGDYDDGLVHARKALELAPNDSFSYVTLALAEYRLGHWNESRAASGHALTLFERGDPASLFLTAMADWQAGGRESARGQFEQAAAKMREQNAKIPLARQLWTEAAELLGQPGPDAARADVPAAAKPR
jgi:tetratricopeptide (TPR) repeat protein